MSNVPTVLIAEDDPVFRRVLTFTVAKAGVQVEAVADGAAAYDRLVRGGIDFLVTDQQMPLCNGTELLQRVKETAGMLLPPTILCTAKGLELDRQSLIETYDLVAVMHKPFSPRKLSELIRTRLREVAAGLSNHV